MDFAASFFLEAGMATAYLALKLFLILSIAKLIRPKWELDQLSSLIAGWILIQAVQFGVIIGLSTINLLLQPYFLAIALLSASLIFWRTRSLAFGLVLIEKSWRNYLPLAAIGFVLLAMWARSLFFYDYTWDAQSYGLPRLAIWLNYGTVFIHMPTLQLNLFVNEWNGELNALAYALFSGSYLGFAFGNLEVLLVMFVTIAWVAQLLGSPVFWSICLSAALGSAPAMLGLASTVKGDLLACTAFILAFGWLVSIKRDRFSRLAFGMMALSAALAVGSKISVVSPTFAILVVAIVLIGRDGFQNLWRLSIFAKLGLVAGLLIFSSRFWTNLVVYGNPLKRIDAEQASFSFNHMVGNLELSKDRMFGVWEEMQGNGLMWALAGSMGWAAWFIVIVALLMLMGVVWRFGRALLRHPRPSTIMTLENGENSTDKPFALSNTEVSARWLAFVGLAILVTTAAAMTLTEAYPWAFRYFAPGIIVLLLGIGAIAIRTNTLRWGRSVLAISAALVVATNLAITSRPGEVLPTPHFQALAMEVEQANSPLKRISLLIKGPYQIAAVEALGLDSGKPLNILVFKDFETSFIPFLGSRAQNKIQTVADGKEFIAASAQPGWDVVAILYKVELRDPSLKVTLEQQGYWVFVDNAQYVIAFPKSRIDLTPLTDLKEFKWSPWNSAAGAKLSVSGGQPEVESLRPIDTGFVSQELRFKGPILVRASFEGEIAGTGTHAAHLSLHGKQPIITLPAGSYSSSQVFQGLVPAQGEESLQRLSFGLGGWAEGNGHLRLTNLEVLQLRIVDGERASIGNFAPPKKQKYSVLMIVVLGIVILTGCAIFGRNLLLICGVKNLSILGGGLVLGYGIFGLFLLQSLKYFGSPMIGALAFSGLLGAMTARKFYFSPTIDGVAASNPREITSVDIRSQSKSIEGLMVFVVISWVVAIVLTYLPLGWLAVDPKYQLPDIFDLPKHLFAQMSIYRANNWPPPNPFFSNESFAYNFLFYAPPAFIAKLVGDPLANFQTFPLAVIAVAIALPMTVLDIIRSVTQSKLVHLGSVLLTTWVGGLTPLWVEGQPAIGHVLFGEKLITSKIWVDEVFQSLIYVPQHVFAVLCGLVAMFLLVNIRLASGDYKNLFMAGIITLVGAISSLILLPHLLVSFVVGVMVSFFVQWRVQGSDALKAARRLPIVMALVLPCALVLPFITEALKWSGGTGALTTMPEFSAQWFYVLSAIGLAVPLAIFGLVSAFHRAEGYGIDPLGKRVLASMFVLIIVGLVGLLFAGYPDAGLKSGLWVRITLIPLAGIGLLLLLSKTANKLTNIVAASAIALLFLIIGAVNYPTTRYYIQSAWRPVDPGIKSFIGYVRALPEHSRIALFSTEQVLVALSGRQMDFDFAPIRADAYMSPEGRIRARDFWEGIMQNDSTIWSELGQRYDYLIAPVGSLAGSRLAAKITVTTSLGGYSVYETKISGIAK